METLRLEPTAAAKLSQTNAREWLFRAVREIPDT